MIIFETQRFARFSDSDGNGITLSLLSLDGEPGSEQPGWFISKEMTDKVFSGPCSIDVSKLKICITHLAQQKELSTIRPTYKLAWIPLLDEKLEVKYYLHLYNYYVDDKSKTVTFRIKTKHEKEYSQYNL